MSTKKEAELTPTNDSTNSNTNENQFVKFMKNHILSIILLLGLIVMFVWMTIENKSNLSQYETEKSAIITEYENRIDSLQTSQLMFATEVFSWSVRSELLRENSENLNQLLTVFVKKSGANMVQIIDPKNQIILLSSDKKLEGNVSEEYNLTALTKTELIKNDEMFKILSPVMGFNNTIGVLVVEMNR